MQVKLNQIRAVAFDLDGTLIDTLPDLTAAVNATLASLGLRALPQGRVKELIGDGADTLVARAVADAVTDEAASQAARQSEAMQLFLHHYSQHLFSQSRLYPEATATLRMLKDSGMLVCCVTNKSSRFALPLLELADMSGLLRFTLCADRTEDRKPSPALLLEACRRLEVLPSEMLYVGDSHTDVIAAHAAGCGAVAVTAGYDKPGALERVGADATVSALMDIVTRVLRLSPKTIERGAHAQEIPT